MGIWDIEVDLNEAKEVGIKRQEGHIKHNNSTRRFFENPYEEDIIGVIGELAIEKKFGLKMDREVRPKGDGHYDFTITVNGILITIDIKTARKPYNLLIKNHEIDVAADVNILAGLKGNIVTFLGWETKTVMKDRPKKDFGYGIINYYKHSTKLRPMEKIAAIINASDEVKLIKGGQNECKSDSQYLVV